MTRTNREVQTLQKETEPRIRVSAKRITPSHLKNPLVNEFSRRYNLRRENGSAKARQKRGGRSAEARRFRRKRAEARGSVAEGSPKQLVQTLIGVPTELFETDSFRSSLCTAGQQ
jgi:hypothetical protein